ncbi:hypothetical protein J7L01_00565, partial [bacterium]|nr:hypothetical protein [bacterium]
QNGDVIAGTGVTVSGGSNVLPGSDNVTVSHRDLSSQSSVDNSYGSVIQDVSLDFTGHVTRLVSYNLDNRYYTESEVNGAFLKLNGTNSPTASINWNGQNITNINKLYCQEVDPVVKIGGAQYSTWMAENIGVRVEVVGEDRLTDGRFEVDLATQPEGSNLWLFYNVVAEKGIIPFVVPQDEAYLMCKMEGSRFIVKAISGDRQAHFSYRLSGKRIDKAALSDGEINRIDDFKSDIYIDRDKYDKNGNLK